MRVVVAGAGIGGLTAALSLHAAGIDVVVVEAARELQPLGVGINLLPHATRELTELGLADELATIGIATARLAYHDRFGSRIWEEPRGVTAGYPWPQYSIHRGRLQQLLLDAVLTRLGPGAVQVGRRVERFADDGDGVVVETAAGVERGDVLVGADGIHSVVRSQLHPGEGPPLWNGVRMYRGVTRCEPFLDGCTMIMAGSNLAVKLVAYPITADTVNWVVEVKDGEPGGPADWSLRADPGDVVPYVADWRFDWLDVPTLVLRADRVFQYPMVDRDPLERWTKGRVTLLGDAAHPMYPIGSNGGTQAIIDARVLAWSLHHFGSVEGPAAYERERLDKVNALVLANRGSGPERVMSLVAQRAPDGFRATEDVIAANELDEIAATYKQIAGFAVDELARSPSWTVS